MPRSRKRAARQAELGEVEESAAATYERDPEAADEVAAELCDAIRDVVAYVLQPSTVWGLCWSSAGSPTIMDVQVLAADPLFSSLAAGQREVAAWNACWMISQLRLRWNAGMVSSPQSGSGSRRCDSLRWHSWPQFFRSAWLRRAWRPARGEGIRRCGARSLHGALRTRSWQICCPCQGLLSPH